MISAILNQFMAHTGTKPLAWHRDEWLMDCMVAWASGSPRPVRGGQPFFPDRISNGLARLCVLVCLCACVSVSKHHASYHASSIDLVSKATITSMVVHVEKKKINRVAGRSDGRRAGAWVLIFLVFFLVHPLFPFTLLPFLFCFPFYSLLCHCASSVAIKLVVLHQHSSSSSSGGGINLTPTYIPYTSMHANVTWLPLPLPLAVQPSVMLLMKQPANGQPRHRIGSRPHPRLGRSNARL
ncbi:hypothetical protein V8C34DRAFT_31521 [Trichoderma compactum]